MAQFEISHNDIGEIERGTWRKFNPYNPYSEDNDEEKVNDLKVDSLDDLFNEDDFKIEDDKNKEEVKVGAIEKKETDIGSFDDLFADDKPEIKPEANTADKEKDDFDLQKELEAKFDELFGPIDDE